MAAASSHETLRYRIQSEYSEMPGLKLTLWQAERLWNVPNEVCEKVLASLVQSGFLRRNKEGYFLRA
jgi:hypothetical protein